MKSHGVKYPSLPQCCEDLEINPISVRLYMEKNGVSSTRAITHYIKSKEKRAFEFRGKEYKNFTECCLAYGLKPKSVSSAVFKAKRGCYGRNYLSYGRLYAKRSNEKRRNS